MVRQSRTEPSPGEGEMRMTVTTEPEGWSEGRRSELEVILEGLGTKRRTTYGSYSSRVSFERQGLRFEE